MQSGSGSAQSINNATITASTPPWRYNNNSNNNNNSSNNNNNNNSNNNGSSSNNNSSNNKEEEEGRAPPPRLPSRTATRPRVSVSSKLLPPLDFSRPPRTASGPDAFAARPKRRFRLPTRPLSSTATGTIYTRFWKTRLYSNA